MSAPHRTHWTSRLNFRLIVFLVLVSVLPLGAVYAIISYQIHGGIEQGKDMLVVDLKALGNFPFNQATGTIRDVPSRWRELDGKRVQLTGFTNPLRQAGNELTEFEFVYNRTFCCFGPLRVQERVYAFVPGGKRVPNYDGLCQLTGVLHVNVKQDAGAVISVYTLDVESLESSK